MTLASRRFLHPEAISRLSRMEVRARHIVEGFLSGMHRSPYFGQSVEFAQHREYVSGDDTRHLDWKLWGKTGRYYIKQYEAETNLRCKLLVDVSKSMRYGSGPMNKHEYACTAAVSLGYLLLKQQDAVSCMAFDDRKRNFVPYRSQHNHLMSIIQSLDGIAPTDKSDISRVLRYLAEEEPRRGMMIIFSDLFTPRPALFRALKLLKQRGHDVLVFHILDDDELDFPFSGPTRFDGLETDDRLNCNPRALRDGYLESLNRFLEEIRRGCTQNACDYRLVRTSEPLDAALASFLEVRNDMIRRR